MRRGVDLDRLRPQVGLKATRTGLKVSLIVGAGLAAGLITMAAASVIYKNSLLTRVKSIAQAMDTTRVTGLTESDGSQTSQDYTYVREKLANLKAVNGDVRFVYLMSRNSKKEMYFLADSEPQKSPGHSPRGEIYPEASPQLRALLDTGKPFVEGPSKDKYGTWLSAVAPVVDDSNYRMTAIVGMDVPASSYLLLLLLTGGVPLMLSLLAASIVYVQHQNRRRHLENLQIRAEMMSIASHELRTPLTGLRWSQESLLSHKLPPDGQQHQLEIMYDSTLKLQESIEDILQLANIEAGKYRLYKKTTDLRAMITDIADMQRLAADRLHVTIEFAPEWPQKLELHVDSQRLKRVFHNLLSNAIKYSRPDSKVEIGYHHSEHDGHVISIRDHGIGIPVAEQEQVWSGFYRASNTAAHDVNGTGMGLYLARQIIDQHQGKTWLESVEGEGTTVFVELPEDTPQAGDAPSKAVAAPMQTKG